MTCYVGVDVGLNGGIGVLVPGSPAPAMFEMPTLWIEPRRSGGKRKRILDSVRVRSIFAQLQAQYPDLYVMIEMPQTRPAFTLGKDTCAKCGQPSFQAGQSFLSMLKFAGQFERIAGILEGLGIAFSDVHPATWKADVFRGVSDKSDARRMAQSMFPAIADRLTLKKSDGLAEAVLLADYARRRMSVPF